MKALVIEQYKEFLYKGVPTPVPGEEEALVRLKAYAVCGSDVHGMDRIFSNENSFVNFLMPSSKDAAC